MTLDEAIGARRSVRSYRRNTGLERTLIEQLIHAAVQAPSAMNAQPWVFTVVRDQGELRRISDEAKAHMLASAPAGQEGDQLHAMLKDPNYHIFYHAPALILISARIGTAWSLEDCALAAQNLMLKAQATGLGSCWIGFAQSFLNTSRGREILGLHPACLAVAPIIVGYPAVVVLPVPRNAPEIRWFD
jgi:nitroreductase